METDSRRFFMLDPETKKHHTTNRGRGLWKHFPGTCNTYEVKRQEVLYTDVRDKQASETSFDIPTEIRIVPTSKGIVVVLYFAKGRGSRIVFEVQIGPNRNAWQNISWQAGFHLAWDEEMIKEAVDNFLWVAECEEAKQYLPKKSHVGKAHKDCSG